MISYKINSVLPVGWWLGQRIEMGGILLALAPASWSSLACARVAVNHG